MKLLSKYTCYLYIVLWVAYGLQRILMLKGIVAQLIFVILMAMSFYACYQLNRHHKINPYLKWVNVMLVVLTLYGFIPIITGATFHKHGLVSNALKNYSYLQGIYISIMPIYSFYYYTLKKQLISENITHQFIILLVYSVISYYQLFYKETAITNREDIVNNIGFLFVPLIPMLSLVKLRIIWRYSLALVLFGFIMLSMKRGAILTGGIMFLLFIKHNFKVRSKAQLASTYIVLLFALFTMYRFVMNLYATNAFFHKRFELTLGGYSSQRDKLYSFFWHYFTERTSTFEFFFGHGANGTVAIYGQYAHNDWLEFAINQGLWGIVLYIVYWVCFILEWKNYTGPRECKTTLGDIIIAYFLITLFSMSFGEMPLAATMCIGYCLAMNKKTGLITLYEDTNHHTRLSRP